jgi:DedD protein
LIVNSRYHTDTDLNDYHDSNDAGGSREISLGTATILGIFLALALLCAAFFGFGYSLGRRSVPPAPPVTEAAPFTSSSAKPAPGSLTPAPSKADTDSAQPTALADSTAKTIALDPEPSTPVEAPVKPAAKLVAGPPSARVIPVSAPAAIAATSGTIIVQVAAVSHPDDADVLMSALKKRGYSVAIHHEPQDKLLHVQIGPFASKKEAEAMRQRLLADGYNAIVK